MIARNEPERSEIVIVKSKATNEGIPDREPFYRTPADYVLLCSECDEEIVRLGIKVKLLTISSPLRSYQLEIQGADYIAKKAVEGNLKRLHNILTKDFDGLDFYCPECDNVYCEKHWVLNPVWDEGFYDYTEGICPEGHERILDD